MKRFDINACFGHWPYWDLPHKTSDDLLALMDKFGIERAACLSLRGVFVDWRRGNQETLAATNKHPDRLVPVATISPFLGGDAAALHEAIDAGARAVRLYPLLHNYSLADEFVDEICQAAAAREVPVMLPARIMMNFRFPVLSVESIDAVVGRNPKTQFILGGLNHSAEFRALVGLMRSHANIACEISCLQGFNGIQNLAGEFGAERVLFGTGAVLQYPACNVAKLDHAEITDTQREKIASRNAIRLLGLKG
ncbi:MAG: hypothetical protein AMJ84_07700 [Acidithiobacillales bacterium SM23_46]|nr:MAG: hypothetical protein AMJ84_07700 [Acidithiobacillales bacterium SM23_46]